MLYKLIYGTVVPIAAVFLSNLFGLNSFVSCIFMGVFTGVFMALFIKHNLFVYTTGSVVVLLISNYLVMFYKHGEVFNEILDRFSYLYVYGAILLIICVIVSTLVVYLIKSYKENQK